MSDLVKRLRWPGIHGSEDHPISVKLRVEAADLIEQQAATIEAQAAEIERLREAAKGSLVTVNAAVDARKQAESALAKAVEVLRPFSTLASDYIDRGLDEDDHVLAGRIVRNNETASPPRVTFADFRRCRAFITEHGSDSNSPPIREA